MSTKWLKAIKDTQDWCAEEGYDAVIMGKEIADELFGEAMFNKNPEHYMLYGCKIYISPLLGYGQLQFTKQEYAHIYLVQNNHEDEQAYKGKQEPKPLHCRICGRTYYDKVEVKECERSHDWHNRRGRR